MLVGMVLNVNAFAMYKANRQKANSIRVQLGEQVVTDNHGLVMVYWGTNTASALRFFFIPFAVSTYTIVHHNSH